MNSRRIPKNLAATMNIRPLGKRVVSHERLDAQAEAARMAAQRGLRVAYAAAPFDAAATAAVLPSAAWWCSTRPGRQSTTLYSRRTCLSWTRPGRSARNSTPFVAPAIASETLFPVAVTVAVALLGATSISTLVAILLPWVLPRFGVDPAFGSGPVATVLQDNLTLAIYFGAAVAVGA